MEPLSKVEVIRSLKGARTQNEYAELLGITSGGLSLVMSGKRGANGVLIRLLALFPDKAREINQALILPEVSAELTALPIAPEQVA